MKVSQILKGLFFVLFLFTTACVAQVQAPAATETPTATIAPTATMVPTPQPSPTPPPTKAPVLTPSGLPNQPAGQSGAFPALTSLSMKDPQNGWGSSQNGVFQTQDGGRHWQNVTPKEATSQDNISSGFYSNTLTAWVIYPSADFNSGTIYHTTDGGQTWKPAQVAFSGGQIFFVDARNGWVLAANDCGAGSCGGSLFATQDGGDTWQAIAKIEPGNENTPGTIPFAGNKSGITFLTPQRGWVTGSIPMTDYSYLFMTEDGGKTWTQQKLALPPGYVSVMLGIEAPRFFSATDGILPVSLAGESFVQVFYITTDGGKTWTPSLPVGPAGSYDFVSPQDGFVWNGGMLHATHDGGKTWAAVKPDVDLSQELSALDFVNPTTGWAAAMNADGQTSLYQTTDGGKTWVKLNP